MEEVSNDTTSVTGATVKTGLDRTLGQVVHEAAVLAGQAEGEFHELDDKLKADLEAFGSIIKAVLVHLVHPQVIRVTTATVPAADAPTERKE